MFSIHKNCIENIEVVATTYTNQVFILFCPSDDNLDILQMNLKVFYSAFFWIF